MSIYSDLKEIYNDIKNDKFMMIIVRILGSVLIGLFIIITYKAIFEPVNICGIELNKNKVKHDTIIITVHDTITLTKEAPKQNENSKLNRNNVNGKTDVKSINQKGGQTANQINNN